MAEEEFDFSKAIPGISDIMIIAEELAKFTAPMFLAYRKQGLSLEEAAVLTATVFRATAGGQPTQQNEDDDGRSYSS